jgi:hypothetical protein
VSRRNGTWRCPRCGQVGDPRSCTCMRRLRDYCEETLTEIRLGRSIKAEAAIAKAQELLRLLALDGQKARGVRTGG